MSDGDAKTYPNLNNVKPYGVGVTIIEHECVRHVQKHLRKALHELRKKPVYEDVKGTRTARAKFARDQAKQLHAASQGKGNIQAVAGE